MQKQLTCAKNVAKWYLKLLKKFILSDIYEDAKQYVCCIPEPSPTQSLNNWVAPLKKAYGPLSHIMKYALLAFDPWNHTYMTNLTWTVP